VPTPAVGLWEFTSIPAGVECADAIVKGAPIESILTGTTHPGKYVVLVIGDTASVDVAWDIVNEIPRPSLVGAVFLPDIADAVADALVNPHAVLTAEAEAVGVVETPTIAAGIDAADAAVKHADVALGGLRLADGLNGKAYFVVDGVVGEVQAAVEASLDRCGELISDSVVIPRLTRELREDLEAAAHFIDRLAAHGGRG
jgi:microcompartment protein CcmL/EutN